MPECKQRVHNTSPPSVCQPNACVVWYALPQVGGRPAFLDPEATRPIAAVNHVAAHAQLPTAGDLAASSGRQEPGEGFDISRLAPKVKGQQ